MKYLQELLMFDLSGTPVKLIPWGEGHINNTYLVETDKGNKYIFQRINSNLFTDVHSLMTNISLVTSHVAKKVSKEGGDITREVLTIVPAKDGQSYVKCGQDYFRTYIFIDEATSYQIVPGPAEFYQSAYAFGKFQRQLSDFEAALLKETIPNFHNTVARFESFLQALKSDPLGRAAQLPQEVEFVLSRRDYCDRITSLLSSGKMPLRVTHNDTKLNNVMIDNKTGKALAVIDLDTVMPGSSCYDFGDSIRFGCNPAAEDEKDLSIVNFRIDLFETYAQGYLGALAEQITQIEKDNLAFGALLMTYECGMRFLTDHILGDKYFRIHRTGHNLDRARTQFKLASDMEKQMTQMTDIISAL